MNKLTNMPCPVCTSPHLDIFFEMLSVPIYCNLLWPEQKAAQNCPRGDIKLAFCSGCGFITNVAFDPSKLDYSQDYENSLHYSPHFQKYAHSLAAQLVEHHKLHQKDIIEIGCGKGDFLVALCELGNNRGVGFDPSYVSRPEHQLLQETVTFIKDFYSQQYQEYQADLICCRHTLEHVLNPAELLGPLRQAIGDRLNTHVFFEVPNALDTFRHLGVWDIIYEHCCYYAPSSLTRAFTNFDFQVGKLYETFNGQFLCLEAMPIENKLTSPKSSYEDEVQSLLKDIGTFKSKFQDKLESWHQKLDQLSQSGQTAAIWGAGSKGVTFLNLLNNQDVISCAVDLNPRKQGMYVAGTGQTVVPPEYLQAHQPDVVIIMNPIYEEEIRKQSAELGLSPEFLCM